MEKQPNLPTIVSVMNHILEIGVKMKIADLNCSLTISFPRATEIETR